MKSSAPPIPEWMTIRGPAKAKDLTLHLPFETPADWGKSASNYIEFTQIYQLIRSRLLDYQLWEKDRKIEEIKRESKILKVVAGALKGDDHTIAKAARALKKLELSEAEKHHFFNKIKDVVIKGSSEPAESIPKNSAPEGSKTVLTEGELADKKRYLDFVSSNHEICTELFEKAKVGDTDAAQSLADIASFSTVLLTMLGRVNLTSLQAAAQKSAQWPVVATLDPKWDIEAKKLLRDLAFGKTTYLSGLNPAIAFDDSALRKWARCSYEIIQMNRDRAPMFEFVEKGCAVFIPESRFTFREVPEWVIKARDLPPFAKSTAKAWSIVLKNMIRSDCPDFHLLPDWDNFRRHHSNLDRHGNVSKGRLQNDILEKISSALLALAQKPMPDSGNPKHISVAGKSS